MALVNTHLVVKNRLNIDTFLEATHNQYMVVGVRPYTDKKGVLPDGFNLELQVIKDDFDYGIDPKTGLPRENNLYQNFNVTVLDRSVKVAKGDIIGLNEFDADHSYQINFDLLLRFKGLKMLRSKAQAQATQPVTKSNA